MPDRTELETFRIALLAWLVSRVIPAFEVPVSTNVFVPVPAVAVTVSTPATPTLRFSVAEVAVSEIGLATLIVLEPVSEALVEIPRVLVALNGVAVWFLY